LCCFTFGKKTFWPLHFWARDIWAKDILAKDIWAKNIWAKDAWAKNFLAKDISVKIFFFDFLENLDSNEIVEKEIGQNVTLANKCLWPKRAVAKMSLSQL